ncbi:MAG TPA: TlpA disulfide reductase family protein [Kofleriaceae bacterium]|jgi:thiol-disulfide isomerase/thioredoxin|nr:TlpA disulfide reductase family protein [Kofleriaceae bacterium]
MRPTIMRGPTLGLFSFGLAVLAGFAVLSAPGTAHADVLKVGDRLAELDVAVDAGGHPVKLKAWKGKWLVVTVGADWCKPCAKELPTWDKLAGELKGKVVFVAIDLDEDLDTGKRFHDKLKIRNMQRVYLPAEKSGVAASYGAATMPSTFVGDPKGVVRFVQAGFEAGDTDGEYKKLKEALDKLVK